MFFITPTIYDALIMIEIVWMTGCIQAPPIYILPILFICW